MTAKELALNLAIVKHEGQCRKGTGEPYINHVIRVAESVYGWKAKTIAYLHDLVEDTNITLDILLEIGFTDEIVECVDVLTRRVDQSYDDYIARVKNCQYDIVRQIKLADLKDNLRDIDDIPGMSNSRKLRYVNAQAILLNSY